MKETIKIGSIERTVEYSIDKPYYNQTCIERTSFSFFFIGFWISFIPIVLYIIRADFRSEQMFGYIFGAFVGCAVVSGALMGPFGWFCYWLFHKYQCSRIKKKEQKVIDSMRADIIYKLSEKL